MRIVPSRMTTGRERTPPTTHTVIQLLKLRESPTTTTSVVATTHLTLAIVSSLHGRPAVAINRISRRTPEADSRQHPSIVAPLPTLKTIKNITSLTTRVNVFSNNKLPQKMTLLTRCKSLEATDRTTAMPIKVVVQIGTALKTSIR